MIDKKILLYLKKHEGLSLKPYICPAGKLTIGVGRNLEDNGISEEEALFLLRNDVERCERELREIFPDFDNYHDNLKMVLIDMIFNLGKTRFLKFKKMIKAVKSKRFKKVIKEMKNSLWCKQVKNRCKDNVALIKELLNNGDDYG